MNNTYLALKNSVSILFQEYQQYQKTSLKNNVHDRIINFLVERISNFRVFKIKKKKEKGNRTDPL